VRGIGELLRQHLNIRWRGGHLPAHSLRKLVYHAIPVTGQPSLFNYVDIDEANRKQMHMSSVNRREQMVSDGLNLVLDLDHWNSINPDEEPIQQPMDLTLDIEIRKAADDEDDDAA
jgi:hypothetical protein